MIEIQPTFRHAGWMISLQMEHSMSIMLNFSSSFSIVSSFPASPHTEHTAVCGRMGYRTHTKHRWAFTDNLIWGWTQTYRYALSHDAGLLHTTWSSKLLHILAEVALPTLFARTGLALPAARPSAPGIWCAATGRELYSTWSSGWRRAHLGLCPIKRPWLKCTEGQNAVGQWCRSYLYRSRCKT